jgi:hypothetical protein
VVDMQGSLAVGPKLCPPAKAMTYWFVQERLPQQTSAYSVSILHQAARLTTNVVWLTPAGCVCVRVCVSAGVCVHACTIEISKRGMQGC